MESRLLGSVEAARHCATQLCAFGEGPSSPLLNSISVAPQTANRAATLCATNETRHRREVWIHQNNNRNKKHTQQLDQSLHLSHTCFNTFFVLQKNLQSTRYTDTYRDTTETSRSIWRERQRERLKSQFWITYRFPRRLPWDRKILFRQSSGPQRPPTSRKLRQRLNHWVRGDQIHHILTRAGDIPLPRACYSPIRDS